MRDFFDAVFGDGEGKAVITRCDVKGEPSLDKFFSWPEHADKLVAFCEKHKGENVYFTPTLWESNSRRKTGAKALSVAFADADTFDISQFKVEPSIIVHTSPGKTHTYWILDKPYDPSEVEAVNHGISLAHPKETTGLDNGWASNKLLRVPGTSNLKYDETTEVVAEFTGVVYSLAELENSYPKATEGVAENKQRENIPTRAQAMGNIALNSTISDILEDHFTKGGRSEALYFAEQELFRAGASDEDAFAILRESNLNKWAEDGFNDADDRLWEDILRARARSDVQEAGEVAPVVQVEPMFDNLTYDFLTEAEKDSLEATWIDDFVAWSASKTNASKDFQIASAFTALATVFSDFGCVPTNWGNTPLNLWFMVLGRTTLDRKSTVKSHMLRVLNRLSDGEEYNYDLGSDFTVEGLSGLIRDTPNRSGVVVRDEIQGFLKELNTKTYMSGTKEALTDLYGGTISGKLRSTGEKKRVKSVNFALSFYGMGIQEQVGEVLDSADFGSGFLTRFIWIEPTDIEERSDDINAGFTQASKKDDTAFYALVDKLRLARDTYEQFVDGLDSEAEPVFHTEEAFERQLKFRKDMMDKAVELGRNEVVAPADRLSHSVLKCATLLAMAENSEEVQLKHVLSAINYCNTWFTNMLKMASMVSESQWQKRLDDVLGVLIEHGGEMPQTKLYAQFNKELKPREFSEVLESLEGAGYIAVFVESKKKVVRHIGKGGSVE